MSGTRGELSWVGQMAESAVEAVRAFYDDNAESRTERLAKMPYAEYLETPEWQELRRSMVRAAGFRCQWCGTGNRRLDVHHQTYERRGRELREDLIVLCDRCHAAHHGVSI